MGDDRKRVEIRLPAGLVGQIDELAEALGVGRASFVALSSAMLMAQLQPVHKSAVKRRELVDALDHLIQDIMAEAYRYS